MTIMKRKSFITIIAMVLCIIMCLPNTVAFAAEPTDQTGAAFFTLDYLRIGTSGAIGTSGSGAQVIMQDGAIKMTDIILGPVTSFRLEAKWGVSDTTGMVAGDYLLFDLPMSSIITYQAGNGDLNDDYGTWEIFNAGTTASPAYKVKFTLATQALISSSLTDGLFGTYATVKDMGADGVTGTTYIEAVPIDWIVYKAASITNPVYSSASDDLYKTNGGYAANDTVTYGMRFNEALTKARYEALANSGTWDAAANKRTNVMIVDELPDNLQFDGVTAFNMYLRGPYDNGGKIVQSSVDYYSRSLLSTEIKQTSEASWEEFYKTVQAAAAPCYGVFDEKYIIINLGEVSGSESFLDVYNRLFSTSYSSMDEFLKNNLTNYGSESKVERATRWQLEAPGVFTDDMNVWNYAFNIRTKAKWGSADFDNDNKSIKNTATMTYDGGKIEKSNNAIFYRTVAKISLTPGELYLLKVDADSDEPIPNTVFHIQRYTGTKTTIEDIRADNAWEAPAEISTGASGVLRWKGTIAETYKIVEVKAADGYDIDSFELFDKDGNFLVDGIFAMPHDKGVIVRATNTVTSYKDDTGTTPGIDPGADIRIDTGTDIRDIETDTGTNTETDAGTNTETTTETPYIPGGTNPSVPPRPTTPGNTLIPGGGGWVELNEAGVPLGRWDWDEKENKWIFDDNVPLGNLPRTGGSGIPAYMFSLMGLSFLGIGVTTLRFSQRKFKKHEQI